MADTQHLAVTDIANSSSISHLATPSRRGRTSQGQGPGHRHKRSFAISGDFEFLKQTLPPPQQPTTLPTFHTTSPSLPYADFPDRALKYGNGNGSANNSNDDVYNVNPPQRQFLADPLMTNHYTSHRLKDINNDNNIYNNNNLQNDLNTPSPRFFISEEPKFSSPIQGVPDAIINLDDVLKTRPRSFKSHRRSESAPAGLEIILDSKNIMRSRSTNEQRIEEEEDDEDADDDEILENSDPSEDSDGIRNGDANKNSDTMLFGFRNKSSPGLMSPLRPMSPSSLIIQRNNNISPIKKNSNSINSNDSENSSDKFNSLKIKRQKQRYNHYTKQLGLTNNNTSTINNNSSTNLNLNNSIQSQSLREQTSMTSLLSTVSRTPASIPYTPSKQQIVNTPSTPISSTFDNNTNNSKNIVAEDFKIEDKRNGSNTIVWAEPRKRPNSPETFQYRNKTAYLRNHIAPGQTHMHTQLQTSVSNMTMNIDGQSVATTTATTNNDEIMSYSSSCQTVNKSSNHKKSFNFESKIYDVADGDTNIIDRNNESKSTLIINELNYNNDITTESPTINTTTTDDNNSSSFPNLDAKGANHVISRDILLGEPGDTVDLSSSVTSATTKINANTDSHAYDTATNAPNNNDNIQENFNTNPISTDNSNIMTISSQFETLDIDEEKHDKNIIITSNNDCCNQGIKNDDMKHKKLKHNNKRDIKKKSRISLFINSIFK